MGKARLGLLALCLTVSLGSTAVEIGAQSAVEGAPDPSAKSLDVVGGPIAVGSMAVIVSVDAAHTLHLDGVDPISDTIVWQRPYSASAVTPGVVLTPASVGDTVLDVVPAGKPADPAVMIGGVNAATGALEWQFSGAVVLSDNPASCVNNQSFCITGYNPDGTSSLLVIDGATGDAKGVINGPNRAIGTNLYQSDSQTPTFEQLSPSGGIAWTQSVAAIFGPGYDPSNGWDITPVGNLNVGSVGTAQNGSTVNLGSYKTSGFTISTGTTQWTLLGDYQCMGLLAFLSTQVTCQYSGTVHYSKDSTQQPSLRGVTLRLVGFNPATGAVTWSQSVSNVASLSFGKGLSFLDGTKVVVRDMAGKRVLLNTLTGTTAPLKSSQILWCQKVPMYKVAATKGTPDGGKRTGQTLSFPCTTTGTPSATRPTSYPSTVGTTVNGVFVWPSPSGLRTHVVGEPSTTA
jgi:hypothetical protein